MGGRIIIIGGGPVGLGAALELARFGVGSVLVEKRQGTSWHPKTRNFNTRTMEITRGWGDGAYRRLRAIDMPPGWKTPIRFLESATGRAFGHIDSLGFEGPGPGVSSALPVMSSQDLIEEIMLDAARATGQVDLRFSTEATRLVRGGESGDTEVEVEVLDHTTGRSERLAGPALVAADGSDSMIRDVLGIELEGSSNLHHVVNCYFRADIEPHLAGRHGVLLFVNNPAASGVLQPLDGAGRWLCQINVKAEDWSLDRFNKDRARDWVRAASGVAGLEVEILSLGLWRLNATVAQRMVQGRVLLCGDAAHQFPPTGGLGVNTGLQGMHNAMWKLALHVRGLADWRLVETYDTERRPVSQAIVSQSLQNSANVARINAAAAAGGDNGLTTDEVVTASRRYGNHLGVEFGAHYESSAVIPDGSAPPTVADSYSDYAPCATPGCRAPRVALGPPHASFSTHDLFADGFTLICGSSAAAWVGQGRDIQGRRALPLVVCRLGSAGVSGYEDVEDAYGIGRAGAILIRPDGHVAWRTAAPPRSDNDLDRVLAALTS